MLNGFKSAENLKVLYAKSVCMTYGNTLRRDIMCSCL